MKDFKESVQKIDIDKIREDIKYKANSVITKETRVYGDADQFYAEEDKVDGIVIDEVTWKDEE